MHCSDMLKYYSEAIAIIPIIGYNIPQSEVQFYVYDSKRSRKEMEHFR